MESSDFYGFFWSQETFARNGASRFWRHFEPYSNVAGLNKNDDLDVSICGNYAVSFDHDD